MGKRLAPKNLGMLSDMLTAFVAQTIAGIAFNPIDIIKQRLQVGVHSLLQGNLVKGRLLVKGYGLPGSRPEGKPEGGHLEGGASKQVNLGRWLMHKPLALMQAGWRMAC